MRSLRHPARVLGDEELDSAEFGGVVLHIGSTEYFVAADDLSTWGVALRHLAQALHRPGSRLGRTPHAALCRLAAHGWRPVRLWLVIYVDERPDEY